MKYLLDTHTALWFFNGNRALGSKTKDLITRSYEDIFVSYASVWETEIKRIKGKLPIKRNLDIYAQKASFSLLKIELSHIRLTSSLSLIHNDPFDRLLIAQALHENLSLVTGDSKILKYPTVSLIKATS